MLQTFSVRNFALIESMNLSLEEGVTVFTGETGAGKSILMDALGILLGNRASVEYIRTGAEAFLLSAAFSITDNKELQEFLMTENLAEQPVDELIVSRRLARNGKGRTLVNGQPCSIATLAEIGAYLVDIYGQNDNRKWMSAPYHLQLLDSSDPAIASQLRNYHKMYHSWLNAIALYQEAEKTITTRADRLHTLRRAVTELTNADLRPNEENELRQALKRLEHAEKISREISEMVSFLENTGGIREQLASSIRAGERATVYDETLSPLQGQLKEALIILDEVSGELQDYAYNLEFSPADLERIQDRLQELRTLERRYARPAAELPLYLEECRRQCADIENETTHLDALAAEVTNCYQRAERERTRLNELRMTGSISLCHQINEELKVLNLPDARLQFMLVTGDGLTANGVDRAELFFSANPGEPLKPLADIASGGELARLSLALKSVVAAQMSTPTLILDEIDVGISGNAALRVGERIKKLGQFVQILCITHLAQTAAVGDAHYHLYKSIIGERTQTLAKTLTGEERIEALARMLEGDHYSSSAITTVTAWLNK